MKHRQIIVSKRGGPEVLQAVEEEIPNPLAGEVRVRVLTAGVSAFDLMVRRSGFPGMPRPPFTPGVDIVGVVDALGEGVSTVAPGQNVAALLDLAGGGYAEYICLPAGAAVPIPGGLDPAESVCLVGNYLTAHRVLHRTAQVQSGERILIHGAAGGVGAALLDLGKLVGLEMYGTASEGNHEIVSSLGATPIDYRAEDFVERVRTLTGEGVDAVFDPIGGARQLWRSYRALRKGGRLVWFGVAATSREGMSVIPLSLLTRFLLSLIPDGKRAPNSPDPGKGAWYHETLTSLFDSLSAGQIRPLVAARFPLVEAARAHALLERGGHAGKVVLVAASSDDSGPLPLQ